MHTATESDRFASQAHTDHATRVTPDLHLEQTIRTVPYNDAPSNINHHPSSCSALARNNISWTPLRLFTALSPFVNVDGVHRTCLLNYHPATLALNQTSTHQFQYFPLEHINPKPSLLATPSLDESASAITRLGFAIQIATATPTPTTTAAAIAIAAVVVSITAYSSHVTSPYHC